MTTQLPYCLVSDDGTSDAYYRDAAAFADAWIASVETRLKPLIDDYLKDQQRREVLEWTDVPERDFNEAAFEFLALGVLLREHGTEALEMPDVPAHLLARLVEAQDALPLPVVEKPVKALRGWVQGLVGGKSDGGEAVDFHPFDGGASRLVHRLAHWLEASGWGAQAARVACWRGYLERAGEQRAEAVLALALLVAEEFAEDSMARLGAYTRQVKAFVKRNDDESRWRYDSPLITRSRVEYHLAMLGTEILTRAYRQRYLKMKRKIVIVPDCLCLRGPRSEQPEGVECKAKLTSLGLKCAACDPACRVLSLSLLGKQHGFEVYILPDDFRGVGLGACSKLRDTGVVGVSCALTNWDAGWMVNDRGVPAQGVLLDYAGCRSHWSEKGQPTDLNIEKLLQIVG